MAVGDHSQLTRFNPRYAGKAAMSAERQHLNQVKLVLKHQLKRKLPMTQVTFNQKVMAKR
jgi:hypothetical protein